MASRNIRWTAIVEVKPLDQQEYGAAGAFTNVIVWASNAETFRLKLEGWAQGLKMYVAEVEDARPVGKWSDDWPDEFQRLYEQSEQDKGEVFFGMFHEYPHDEA